MQEIERFWTTADGGERVQVVECRDPESGAIHYQTSDDRPVRFVQPGLFADVRGNRLVADDAGRRPGGDPQGDTVDFARLAMRP